MTPDVGTELINPHAGTKTVFLATAESTGGEYLEIEVTYPPNSARPPMHKHPTQQEQFTVLAGAIEAIVDRSQRTVSAGAELVVPAGAAHRRDVLRPLGGRPRQRLAARRHGAVRRHLEVRRRVLPLLTPC